MGEQYNYHCLVTAGGLDWWIDKAIPGHLKLVRHIEGGYLEYIWMDITKIDWESYIKKAVEMDYANSRRN